MSIERLFTTSVTIIEPGTADDGYGGTAPDWDNPASETDVLCWFTQTSSTEQLGERDVAITSTEITCPAGTAISSIARVRKSTTTYEVVGDPDTTPQTPSGGQHHVIARLTRASEVTA